MCTVLLPPGLKSIAVNKIYIHIYIKIIYYKRPVTSVVCHSNSVVITTVATTLSKTAAS